MFWKSLNNFRGVGQKWIVYKKKVYFFKKSFSKFEETDFSYVQGHVYPELQHIQNQKHIESLRYIQNAIKHLRWKALQNQRPRALLSLSSIKVFKKSTPKKFLIFQGMELCSSKIKNLLIFLEIKLSSCNIKKFLIFFQIKSFSCISRN